MGPGSHSYLEDEFRRPSRLLTDLSLEELEASLESNHLDKTLEQINSLRYAHGKKYPWLDEHGNRVWSWPRVWMARIVFTQAFETLMGVIIMVNLCFIVYEADQDAKCYPAFTDNLHDCPTRSEGISWLVFSNVSFLTVYTLECSARLLVETTHFFCNYWNMTDLLIVVLGWFSAALAGTIDFSLMRITRLVRILRAARVFISIPEFYLLISGLASSMKAIIFGSLLLVVVIAFWSVISVEFLHPIVAQIIYPQCLRCSTGFSSVGSAALTLFQQIVAGDSWGEISVPLAEMAPWTAPLLFVMLITISMGVLNLILAVIVEQAADARDQDQDQKLKKKELERSRNMLEFAVLCSEMDVDKNGKLSLEEMMNGCDKSDAMAKLMHLLDLRREDLATVFRVVDDENKGEVSYLQLCQLLASFLDRDPVIVQSLIKYSVADLRKLVQHEVVDLLRQQQDQLKEQTNMIASLREEMQLIREPTKSTSARSANSDEINAFREALESSSPKKADVTKQTNPLEKLALVPQEMEPLLSKAEALLNSIDTSHYVLKSQKIREPDVTKMHTYLGEVLLNHASDKATQDHEPAWNQLFLQLSDKFQEQMRRAELLQDRFRNVIHDLGLMKADVDAGTACLTISETL